MLSPATERINSQKMSLAKSQLSNKSTTMNPKNVILCLTLMLATGQVLTLAFHLPRAAYGSGSLMRRQDSDLDSDGEDEMDSGASAPGYQNQNEGQSGDGYEDNEPDGAYEETPRDEDSQADLERFFDDHLGASEKEGMDKENLPTNIIPIAIPLINPLSNRKPGKPEAKPSSYEQPAAWPTPQPNPRQIQQNQTQQQPQPLGQPTDIETRYIKLPDNKLIITRQSISRGPIYKGGLDLPEIPPIPENYFDQNEAAPLESRPREREGEEENLNAKGSQIVATEDDDFDRVYVTKLNNKPFKIDALGGYDPEEDFRDASRDLEESSSKSSRKRRKSRGSRRDESEEEPQKDITFNDPEAEVLFEDASETDQVTFGPNDEHDLEAEMRAQSYDQPGKPTSFKRHRPSRSDDDAGNAEPEQANSGQPEGSWADDGVEEMEIPSQSHQDAVLAKAARQEELARRAAEAADEEAEQEAPQDQANEEEDRPEGQRMANADYMKDDLPAMDDEDNSGFDS